MQEKLNDDFILKNGGYSNYEDTTILPRHRWYYYKEGFSPNLVEKAIEQTGLSNNDLIIDPFNGSGTTTLTSTLLGYNSIGIEVNPFTAFLSDVKLKSANVTEFEKLESRLYESVDSGFPSPLIGVSTFSEKENINKWLFNNSVLNAFEGGWKNSELIDDINSKELIQLALISAAMQNCNARRDGKCFRYREGWDYDTFNKSTFLKALTENISIIRADIENQPISGSAKILKGDCRDILQNNNTLDNFKLCITSPPYLNTFDYTDIYRPELFLGKFIEKPKELYDLRLKTVRSHIQAKWEEPVQNDFGIMFHQTMKHVLENKEYLMHKNIPLMIQAYFEDMLNILKLLKSKAAKDAQVWFVVSNSAYADLEVPVDLIIGDLAAKAGWYLKEIGVLRYIKKRKTKYSPNITQLRESVIILSNSRF